MDFLHDYGLKLKISEFFLNTIRQHGSNIIFYFIFEFIHAFGLILLDVSTLSQVSFSRSVNRYYSHKHEQINCFKIEEKGYYLLFC